MSSTNDASPGASHLEPLNDVDLEQESSGVTSLRELMRELDEAPVPFETRAPNVTTLLPPEPVMAESLALADRTLFFSVDELLARRPTPNADPSAPATSPAPAKPTTSRPRALIAKLVRKIRQASLARKATLVILPLLLGLLLAKPVFRKPAHQARKSLQNVTAARGPAQTSALVPAMPLPATIRFEPAHGVSLEKSAADSVAAGDFAGALAAYRELERQNPGKEAYREAARILQARLRVSPP